MPEARFSAPLFSQKNELFDPTRRAHIPVRDRKDEFANIAGNRPAPTAQRRAFYSGKLRQRVRSFADPTKARDAIIPLVKHFQPLTLPETLVTILGSVAAGVYYNDGALDFKRETAIYHYILGPQTVGGDNTNYLYLTATNRSAKGVESFLSYYAQDNPEFRVYDWAKDEADRWSFSIPYPKLGSYWVTKTINNTSIPSLYVANVTRMIGTQQWVNEVFLRAASTNAYDLIYSYQYPVSDDSQQHSHEWGPIVETHQQYQSPTNTLGFAEATLYQDEVFHLLTKDNSYTRNDGIGFKFSFLEENYTFLANGGG